MQPRLLGGKYPLSLGTALIFESKEYDIKKWPNLMYINLRTLYRNYVQSYTHEDRLRMHDFRDFLHHYLEEVAELERIIKEESHNRIKVYFFYPHYKRLHHVLPKVEEKEYNPDKFDEVEENMWKHVKRYGLMTPFNYEEIEQELPKANEPVIMLTSFVVDLLSAYNFPILYLLESFTGRIKRRQEWYTKINVGKDKIHGNITVPFNKFTVQIFGDKSGALTKADIELRKVVKEMAIKDHWTPLTTMDKIKYSISKLSNAKLKELLFKYL